MTLTRDQARELARNALSVCCVYSEHITPQGRTAIEDAIVQAYELGAKGECHSMESAPKEGIAHFWIVPKVVGDEGVYCNTSGAPILGTFEPFWKLCRFGDWSSMCKATHWTPYHYPLPPPEVSNET